MSVVDCPRCGMKLEHGMKYCPGCGVMVSLLLEEAKESDKLKKAEEKEAEGKKVKEKRRRRVWAGEAEPKTREEERASKVLDALRQYLMVNVSIPVPLRDDRRGDTLEEYPVGIANVRIAYDGLTGLYMVTEPEMSGVEKLVYALTVDAIYRKADVRGLELELLRGPRRVGVDGEDRVASKIDEMISSFMRDSFKKVGVNPDEESVARVRYFLNREIFGLGPVDVPARDPKVEDISCVGPRIPVRVVHRDYAHYLYLQTNIIFPDDEALNDYMNKHAHRAGSVMTVYKPYADFAMSDRSRFAGILGRELTAYGPAFTIRKFPEDPWSLPRLVNMKMLTPVMAGYLWFALENKALIGLAGPTGSGKTSLFTALLACLHPNSKIITVEDVFEINIPHEHWLPMTTRRPAMMAIGHLDISESELIDIAMRMRPDYLVIGEVRKDESVYYLLKSAFTGHGGGFTFHAGSPQEFYSRLSIMLRKTGLSEAMLTFLWGCAMTSFQDTAQGRVRRVSSVAEIIPNPESQTGLDVVEVFSYRKADDSFHPETAEEAVGRSVKIKWLLERTGFSKEWAVGQIEERARLVEEASKSDMGLREFHRLVAERLYKKVGAR